MLSASYVHPEFGFFCPAPRVRRLLWLVLGALVLGTFIRTGGPSAEQDRSAISALVMVPIVSAVPRAMTPAAPPPVKAVRVNAATVTATSEPPPPLPKKPSAGNRERHRNETADSHAGREERVEFRSARSYAGRPADSW